MIRFLFSCPGLSELIKGRSSLGDPFRSTPAGSGKFSTLTKPWQIVSCILACGFIRVCFYVLSLHPNLPDARRHLFLHKAIKPRKLTALILVPPFTFKKKKNALANCYLNVTPDVLSPTAALLLVTSPRCCCSGSSSCCHLFCHVIRLSAAFLLTLG